MIMFLCVTIFGDHFINFIILSTINNKNLYIDNPHKFNMGPSHLYPHHLLQWVKAHHSISKLQICNSINWIKYHINLVRSKLPCSLCRYLQAMTVVLDFLLLFFSCNSFITWELRGIPDIVFWRVLIDYRRMDLSLDTSDIVRLNRSSD
jgi:hypothetical protein